MNLKQKVHQIIYGANFSSLAGNLIFAVFSLCTFLLMVRTIDKLIFGQWVIFVTVASLLDMFRLGLTGSAAIRLISTLKNNEAVKGIGASYQLSVGFTLIMAFIFYGVYFIAGAYFPESDYSVVLFYYPLLAFASLPYQQANVVAQGKIRFKNILYLRIINGGGILGLLVLYLAVADGISLQGVIVVYIVGHLASSLFAMYKSWDGFRYIKQGTRQLRKTILNFGKYSIGSYIGSNLLKSSDTLILSLAPFLGAEAIAIYAIPLKFVEAVEIPLRSFSATAFPRFSQAIEKGRSHLFKSLFSYVGGTTALLMPVVLVLLLFPTFFLSLIGGANYQDSIGVQTSILQIICVYILFLPMDRYSGVALLAIDKPGLNFYKVAFMLIANVLFDLLAVFVFQSLILVAAATLIFTLLGIVIGWFYLFRSLGLKFNFNLKFSHYPQYALNQVKKWKIL